MANEARGLLFEAITDEALNRAVKLARIKGKVFWNEKTVGMSITPDFTIGENSDTPSHVFLVTAGQAHSNYHMKIWRNLAELFESKAQLPDFPIVVSIYYKFVDKQGLAKAANLSYDSYINVVEKPYYPILDEWVDKNLRNSVKTKETRQNLLQKDIASNLGLATSLDSLAKDLAASLKIRKNELQPLWQLMKNDFLKIRNYPKERKTSVRRGIGKLSVLEPYIRELVYKAGDKPFITPNKILPPYLNDLPFFTRSITGLRLIDNEIKEAINLLGARNCELILKRLPSSMSYWINALQNLTRIVTHTKFVEENFNSFTNPERYKHLLLKCFDNPAELSGEESDDKVWVFDIVISLLKAKSNRMQGYGLAQISHDTKTPEFGTGGFLIAPFANREKPLSERHIALLAEGLSKKFAEEISITDISKLKTKLIEVTIKENLEDRLIPYRNFEPLLWLLEEELKLKNKNYTPKTNYTGWLNEYAKIGQNYATTPFVKVGKTLIHWKSVSDAGKDHKKKELSSRARNVKYQYDAKTKTFNRRAGVDRLALIVDGTFTDSDLKVLADSGWDLIIYPHEISDFVSKL